ncbi:uncharacterized protein LOC118812519 [Colossoma macropomum]|uniref:uncharacterized protein LOC118812519 n=1 Tax=Colossoma macropomum TaxID=42526 RepID=UPI001864E225|nr:uncharacterized protein LOC118812519 [Colossoma macropomum]
MSFHVENQGRNFVKAVSPSLKSGIRSLNALTISLLDIDKDLMYVAKDDFKFREIRSAIVNAQQKLGEAESAACGELKLVDYRYEKLMVRKGNLSRQQESIKNNLQNLKCQQRNNKATLDMYKAHRNSAENRLREVREELMRQRRNVEEAEALRDAGIGITFIPIVGWIAGPIMITAAENDIENATFNVEQAEETVGKSESLVQHYSWKVSDYERKIDQTRNEISKTEDELRQIGWEIDEVLMQRKKIADFQEKMRNSVKVLGCLAGTCNVAEIQTRCFVLLEAMMKLLQDFVRLAEGLREDRLLRDEGIKALITNLQVNYIKLKAIAVPPDTSAIEDYI